MVPVDHRPTTVTTLRDHDKRAGHCGRTVAASGGIQNPPGARIVGNLTGERLGPNQDTRLGRDIAWCTVEVVDIRGVGTDVDADHAGDDSDRDGHERGDRPREPSYPARRLRRLAIAGTNQAANPPTPDMISQAPNTTAVTTRVMSAQSSANSPNPIEAIPKAPAAIRVSTGAPARRAGTI